MKNIYDYTLSDLQNLFISLGYKKFNANQVYDWLYKKRVKSFNEMTNIKKELIDYLNNNFGCNIQIGGSDQWGNIIQGCELIRKKAVVNRKVKNEEEVNVFGITLNLLTKSDGSKMGKTAGGAIWLRKDKLSSNDYFQYFRDCYSQIYH